MRKNLLLLLLALALALPCGKAGANFIGGITPDKRASFSSASSGAWLSSISPDSNTFVLFHTNTSTAGDDTGSGGGLSGSDLIATQSGSIPGASGTPIGRVISAPSSQYFTLADNVIGNLISGKTSWTIMIEFSNYGQSAYSPLLYGCSPEIHIGHQTSDTTMAFKPNGGAASYTSDPVPSSGRFIVAMWFDGTYFRGGFYTGGVPTKWSDFDSGKRISVTSSTPVTYISKTSYIGKQGGYYANATLHGILFSKTCLINNAL